MSDVSQHARGQFGYVDIAALCPRLVPARTPWNSIRLEHIELRGTRALACASDRKQSVLLSTRVTRAPRVSCHALLIPSTSYTLQLYISLSAPVTIIVSRTNSCICFVIVSAYRKLCHSCFVSNFNLHARFWARKRVPNGYRQVYNYKRCYC